MKRNLKALGLALMATFAMSAVAASAVQAKGPAHFTQPDDDYPVAITGVEEGSTEDNYFQITGANGPKTHCEDVTYEGEVGAETTTITVTPHFTNCVATTSVGTITTTVDMNGCDFVFTAGKETEDKKGVEGTAEINCPKGEHEFISVTTAFCDTHVPPQTVGGAGGIEFTNVANGDVTVDVDVTNELTYTETRTSIFGPCTNNHHTSDGSFVSNVLVSGYDLVDTHTWTTKDPNGTETELETVTEGAPLDIDVGL